MQDATIQKVKKENNIVDVIGEYTSLCGKNGFYRGNNPFTKDEDRCLLVSEKNQSFQCMDTGFSGDVCSFVMKKEETSFDGAVEFLAERVGLDLPELREEKEKRGIIFQMNNTAGKFYLSALIKNNRNEGYRYLKNVRGISQKDMRKFGLGYACGGLARHLEQCGFSSEEIKFSGLVREDGKDKFFRRVMCPVFTEDGRVAGFSGRALREGPPKYLNSPRTPVFDKKRLLYGLNFAKTSERDGIILCEGNLDVISQHIAGFDNAVAPMGTAFSHEQAVILKKYTDTIHLAYDNDEPGQTGSEKALSILKQEGFHVDVVSLAPYKDPDEYLRNQPKEGYQNRLDNAKDSHLFELEKWMDGIDLTTSKGEKEGKTVLAKKMLNIPREEWNSYLQALNQMISKRKELPFPLPTPSGRSDSPRSLDKWVRPCYENRTRQPEGESKQLYELEDDGLEL